MRHQLAHPYNKEKIVQNNADRYTDEQLMARLKFFIGVCLALTLTGIVFVVLYSIIFVTQPLNAISPIDQKFFELIIPIATFLTGTLSGIMLAGGSKEETEAKLALMKHASENQVQAAKSVVVSTPAAVTPSNSFSSAPIATPSVTMGFGGKLAPTPAPQPEL